MKATDGIEKAFSKDAITEEEYVKTIETLIY